MIQYIVRYEKDNVVNYRMIKAEGEQAAILSFWIAEPRCMYHSDKVSLIRLYKNRPLILNKNAMIDKLVSSIIQDLDYSVLESFISGQIKPLRDWEDFDLLDIAIKLGIVSELENQSVVKIEP